MITFELLKLARELQGVPQSEMALKAGITQSAISKFEAGVISLSEKTLLKIAPLLNINPAYITAECHNPFLSKKLIKMRFREGLASVHFSPLELLVDSSDTLELIFLIPHFRLISKILSSTMMEVPCYSIAVRDGDGNIFLFRRKFKGAFIVGERNLQSRLIELADNAHKRVVFRTKKIEKELYQKIKGWSVVKEDIVALFGNEDTSDILSSEEKEVLRKVRRHLNDTDFRRALMSFIDAYTSRRGDNA